MRCHQTISESAKILCCNMCLSRGTGTGCCKCIHWPSFGVGPRVKNAGKYLMHRHDTAYVGLWYHVGPRKMGRGKHSIRFLESSSQCSSWFCFDSHFQIPHAVHSAIEYSTSQLIVCDTVCMCFFGRKYHNCMFDRDRHTYMWIKSCLGTSNYFFQTIIQFPGCGGCCPRRLVTWQDLQHVDARNEPRKIHWLVGFLIGDCTTKLYRDYNKQLMVYNGKPY